MSNDKAMPRRTKVQLQEMWQQDPNRQWRLESSRPRQRRERVANLPAGLVREARDGHAMDGTARAWCHAWLMPVVIAWTVATACELNDQTLTHKLRTVCAQPTIYVSLREHEIREC